MKIDNISYREFALMRDAIKEYREVIWHTKYAKRVQRKKFSHAQDARRVFESVTNPYTDEGICNNLLARFRGIEAAAQAELVINEGVACGQDTNG